MAKAVMGRKNAPKMDQIEYRGLRIHGLPEFKMNKGARLDAP